MTIDTPGQLHQRRDLRAQLAELNKTDTPEILFEEWSPGRRMISLWSLKTGEEIHLPRYMAEAAMRKREGVSYLFTDDPAAAPKLKPRSIKCFLHSGSPEREILDELGIASTCENAELASAHSKRIHAQHRHKQEWAAYEEHLKEQEKALDRERQDKQVEAMIGLAKSASEKPKKEN